MHSNGGSGICAKLWRTAKILQKIKLQLGVNLLAYFGRFQVESDWVCFFRLKIVINTRVVLVDSLFHSTSHEYKFHCNVKGLRIVVVRKIRSKLAGYIHDRWASIDENNHIRVFGLVPV